MIIFLKNTFRNIDRARRNKMCSLEPLLYRLIRNNSRLDPEHLPKKQVQRILIMRSNKRIGNALFLIPFVRQVVSTYPGAQIDLMLSKPCQGQFFEGLGIRNIHYALFSVRGLFQWLITIQKLKKKQYDLLLAPVCSASDSIVAAMLNAKNKVSSYNEKRLLAFPHALRFEQTYSHSALNQLPLLQRLGNQLTFPLRHELSFTDTALAKAHLLSRKYIGDNDGINIAFFRGARGSKKLTDKQWVNILANFESELGEKINWTEILSPDIQIPLRDEMKNFTTKNMRLLGAFLTNFDGFICCDTGPLHLADAAGAKCIGIYTDTSPKTYGLLGHQCVYITDINNFDVNEIASKLDF